jgi:HlyD family secretion protein
MNQNKTNSPLTKIFNLAAGKRKWLITAGLVVTVAILAILLASSKTSSPSLAKTISTFSARRDNLTVTVTESGSIKARNAVSIKSEVEGQVTIISIIPEGTYILPEDVNNKVLVELDSSNLRENLAQREIEFAGAESSYAEANEAYAIQVKQNESDITTAELKVKFALMDLKKYVGETLAQELITAAESNPESTSNITLLLDDPNKIGHAASSQTLQDLQDQIELAGAKLARAIYKLEGTQQLYDANYVAKLELQGDELEKRSYEIQNNQAGINLDLFKRYDFPKQAEKLLSDYYEAGRELDRTHARARSKLAQAMAQLKSAEARFLLQKDRRDKLVDQIAACKIKAPSPGLVVYANQGDMFHREGPIEAGVSVRQRQEIMALPDTSGMAVEITVHESSVALVRPSQTTKITIDAFPDKTFAGKVLKIAPLPDQQRGWLSPDLKVYTTQVSIDGTHDFLKPGMSAKVEILIEQLQDVLIVPVQVVANRGGKKVCYCLTSSGPQQREVQTGSFNDTFVQITDGLEVGDEVLMTPPNVIEPAKQLAGNLQKPQQPAQAQAAEVQPTTRDQNPAGQPPGTPFDSNQRDDQTKERMKQFRERAQQGEMPFDPNQMDEQTRERTRPPRNRTRPQSDGTTPSQTP